MTHRSLSITKRKDRPAFDLTFCAPMSASLAFVAASDDERERILAAFGRQVSEDLPAAKVKAHAADIGRVVDKATALADQASEPTTITVEGPASLRTWIAARVHAGLKAGSTVKVLEADARTPALVISPVPAVAGAK
jgi:hypothetical protein